MSATHAPAYAAQALTSGGTPGSTHSLATPATIPAITAETVRALPRAPAGSAASSASSSATTTLAYAHLPSETHRVRYHGHPLPFGELAHQASISTGTLSSKLIGVTFFDGRAAAAAFTGGVAKGGAGVGGGAAAAAPFATLPFLPVSFGFAFASCAVIFVTVPEVAWPSVIAHEVRDMRAQAHQG